MITKSMVNVENIVREAITRERQVTESSHSALIEKVDTNWDRIMVIVTELREAIKNGIDTQIHNKKEIESVRESIQGVATAAAQKVVNEASIKAEKTVKEMQSTITALTERVEAEAESSRQTEA